MPVMSVRVDKHEEKDVHEVVDLRRDSHRTRYVSTEGLPNNPREWGVVLGGGGCPQSHRNIKSEI